MATAKSMAQVRLPVRSAKARSGLLAVSAVLFAAAMPAGAHFQSIYTPEANLSAPSVVPVDLIFWHPLAGGATMSMGAPEEFFVLHRGEKIDLISKLRPITFSTNVNSGDAFRADVEMKSPGDYVLSLVPAPYYEESEDKYIQQITKTYVNRGQLPTDWNAPVGLKTEILPLNRPYNILVGSTFSGQVLSDGKPVADAEIEVEYIAAVPDMVSHRAGEPTVAGAPAGTISIRSDANGYFTFGIPRAGWWGFAALAIGPDREFNGKKLSQDAVIWVTASDFGAGPPVLLAGGPPGASASGIGELAGAALPAALTQQITASVRGQIRPIRNDMAVYRATETYPMVLGGIGYIVGLGGLAYFLMAGARARRQAQSRGSGH